MTNSDEDYQSRLRDMVVERLDEAVNSAHVKNSAEPMVPILRQLCCNLQWLLSGDTQSKSVESVANLKKLLKDKPRRECETDRLISLMADALLIHFTGIVSGITPRMMHTIRSTPPSTPSSSTSLTSTHINTNAFQSILSSLTPPTPTTTRTSPYRNNMDNSVPAKKARLEAKINGLVKKNDSLSSSTTAPLFTDLIKRDPVEILCRVGSSADVKEEECDSNEDSGVMEASGSTEENPLIRLLQSQSKQSVNVMVNHTEGEENGSFEDEQGSGSGEEEMYDFSSILLNSTNGIVNDSMEFSDPFVNEPPIFSPSVSTIRKNTRRSKPEKILEKGCTRVNRDPNAPRQVISAYLCFVGEMRMKRNNGDLTCNGGEFGQLLKSEWIKLPDKTRYEMQHEEDKRRYEAELAAWARSERRPVPGRKAYSFYVLEFFDRFKSENPEMTDEEVILKVYVSWRDHADKAHYFQLQQRDKERFRNEMKMYTTRQTQNGLQGGGAAPGQVTITSKQKSNGASAKDMLNAENFIKQELLSAFKFEV